jgi:ATP-dependent DNA helicase RecG
MRLVDLDPMLLERARRGAGLIALSDEEYLVKRKLADHRERDLVLRRGAELLFAKEGPDHPNAGLRLFRVVGTERRVGAEHNVEERPRFEGNLPAVIEGAFSVIDGIIRKPARLVGHHFRTVPEYPEFSWKEAILNAAAHRDYNVEGRTTEIWFFDDRLEVVSPGGLVPDVKLDDLIALHRVHVSRNPRTVRVLVDLGIARDQGEGIPRMFAEMEGLFLPTPKLEPDERLFRVTLRNTPTLTAEDRAFVARLGDVELSDLEFRALLEAHRSGRIDNAHLRKISGLDTLDASVLLRKLRDREFLQLHPAGPASYYELGPKTQLSSDVSQIGERNDPEARGPSVSQVGTKLGLSRDQVQVLEIATEPRAMPELMKPSGRTNRTKFRDQVLVPLLDAGFLEMSIPDKPRSSKQQYRTTAAGLELLRKHR